MKQNIYNNIQKLLDSMRNWRLFPLRSTYYSLRSNNGFTLIEMMVSIFIFSLVMIIAVGALVTILDANRKAQAEGTVMNNINFALESMTRAIRVGTEYNCNVSNCANAGSTQFSFTNVNGDAVTYRLNATEKRIERSFDGGVFLPVTAPEVEITQLRFYADGTSPTDGKQPRVLVIVEGQSGDTVRTRVNFTIQTLITQRILDR